MPELPEVETVVQDLIEKGLKGATILKAELFWERTLATPDSLTFHQQIKDQKFLKIGRRGKFLVFSLSQDTLIVHLRMTGKFLLERYDDQEKELLLEPLRHERMRLYLDQDRILHYQDQRKFGKWYLLASPLEKLSHLGLEPLSSEFTLEAFKKLTQQKSQVLKPFLLNQKYVVGLGNIYVDEALWLACLHPQRVVSSLNLTEVTALHSAIIQVLQQGVACRGTSLGSHISNFQSANGQRGEHQYHLKVFRKQGLPCLRCTEIITRISVAKRSTHFCSYCQKLN